MVQENIVQFVEWYISDKKFMKLDYLIKHFKNDKNELINNIYKWSKKFETAYSFNPFDKNLQGMTYTFIDTLKSHMSHKSYIYSSNFLENLVIVEKIINTSYISFLVSKLYGEDLELYNKNEKFLKLHSEIPLKDEFVMWLIHTQNHTKGTTNSYLSNLNFLNDNYFNAQHYSNLFYRTIKIQIEDNNNNSLSDFLNSCMIQLVNDQELKKKNIFIIGLKKYTNFLMNKINSEND